MSDPAARPFAVVALRFADGEVRSFPALVVGVELHRPQDGGPGASLSILPDSITFHSDAGVRVTEQGTEHELGGAYERVDRIRWHL